TKNIISQALPGAEEKSATEFFGKSADGAKAGSESVFALLGRFADIVTDQVKDINVPCMAVGALKKSGMMTSSAFDEACAKPDDAGQTQP
ncbi:MAG: hypothetical protein ACI4SY_01765, partial [Sutterella sp.]